MSNNTIKIINEGFMRKYMKEDIEKEVFHNDNGVDYDVIERSTSGKNALLNRGKQWIVAWNCPQDSGSWGQGHYFFDEAAARKVWKDKYVNESLEEEDYFDFQSAVYNALSDVMFKYRDKDVDEVDLDKALNWFADRFFDFEFEEKLQECINKLNEAEMSDEDKVDSALLRSIYNKTQQRANAKLTPEEKAVLDKYNLRRDSDTKNIRKNTNENPWGNPLIDQRVGDKFRRWNQDETKINLADRARKMDDRGAGYHTTQGYYFDVDDDHREWKDPETGRWQRLKDKGLLDQERKHQNSVMQEPVRQMKDAISDRNYHQKHVDSNNAEYDARRAKIQAEYEKRLKDNENSRKYSGEYHQKGLDQSKDRIDKLLGRKKEEQ